MATKMLSTASFSDVVTDFRRINGDFRDEHHIAGEARRKFREKSVPVDERTDKLRYIVQKSGGTKQVAARAGVALSTLGSYLAGGEMKLTTAMQICAACGVSLAWLIGDQESPSASATSASTEGFIPVQRARSANASRSENLEQVLFSGAWLQAQLDRSADQLLAIEVKGSAMEPTVHQGDLLLIDIAAASISSLDIHVIEVGGEMLVRRLERTLDGGIVVRTDNDRYPPQVIARDDQDTLNVVGRVVWRGSAAPL